MAHHPTRHPFHQAHTAEAHNPHIVDGAHLRPECGKWVIVAYVIYNFMVYLLNYLNLGMDLEANKILKQFYVFV